jgi:hypothetical protein
MKLAAVFCLASFGLANAGGIFMYGSFVRPLHTLFDDLEANKQTKKACKGKGMVYITDTYEKPHFCDLPSLDAAKAWESKSTSKFFAKVEYSGVCYTKKGAKDACRKAKGKYDGAHSCDDIPNRKGAKAFVCPENKKPKPPADKPKPPANKPTASSKTCKVASKILSYRFCSTMKNCPAIADVKKGTAIKFTCWAKGDSVDTKGSSMPSSFATDFVINKALSGKWGKDNQGRYFYLPYIDTGCAGECPPFFHPVCLGKPQKNRLTTPSLSPNCERPQSLLAIPGIVPRTIQYQSAGNNWGG